MCANWNRELFNLKLKLSRLENSDKKDALTPGELLEIVEAVEQKNATIDKFYDLSMSPEVAAVCSKDELNAMLDRFISVCFSLEAKIRRQNPSRTPSPYELATQSNVEEMGERSLANSPERLALSNAASVESITRTVQLGNKPANFVLPKISLPKFEGKTLEDWMSFKALFKSLIIDNRDLDDVQRLHYLRSTVSDEPLLLIGSLPFEGHNFKVAWDTLSSRCDQARAVAAAHWSKIVNHPPVRKDARALANLISTVKTNINALKALDLPTDSWSFVLVYSILQKLDHSTRELFETQQNNQFPSYDDLIAFLEKTVNALRAAEVYNTSRPTLSPSFKSNTAKPKYESRSLLSITRDKCVACKQEHELSKCKKFLSLKPFERFKMIKSWKLCMTCFSPSHFSNKCTNSIMCAVCGKGHNQLLHYSSVKDDSNLGDRKPDSTHSSDKLTETTSSSSSSSFHSFRTGRFSNSVVLLSTALIDVHVNGSVHTLRALLDTGSQNSFILSDLAKKLGLSTTPTNIIVSGMSNKNVAAIREVAKITFTPVGRSSPRYELTPLCIEQISGTVPSTALMVELWDHVKGLRLADPSFAIPGKIDILLGADVLHSLFLEGRKPGQTGSPTALETTLGWVLVGPVHSSVALFATSCQNDQSEIVSHNFHLSLEEMVQSFWSLEQVPDKKTSSYEDRLCEQFFVQTTKRDQEGRYIVRIPFKPDEPELGNSESIAHRRFMSLERRLEENPDLKKEYSGVISRHIADGHLEIAPEDSKGTEGYVLPHHGVVKDSESTRLRVVFDGSCRTSNGRSLNDTIFPGPKLHNDLVGILLRFRINKIAMAGDIKQMFCQIRIAPEDRKYQKILWRFDKQNPISCYQHTSVVFGLTSSPFLSMRTLLQLVEDEGAPYPEACKILKEQIFVDDFVFSVPDKETALDVYEQLTALLKKGQFEIKKWISSSKEVLSHIPIEDQRSNSSLSFDGDKFLKVLGLSWNVATDCFSYQALEIKDNFTKRGVLSSIARIFDPLGWLSPVTLVAKLVLKELWAQKLDWDTPLPEDVIEKWSRFGQELSSLSKIGINRSFVGSSSSRPVYHLHGFSDASCKAYGCATYLVVEELGKVTSFLLLGKSRVTPQNKSITLPRLELQAAVLLAQMVQVCLKYFNNYIEIAGVYCWTDSTVTLHWINSSPVRWHTFVANRVSDIQENTSVNWWHYVSTEENPADIASRGMEPNDLVQSRLWWHGPPWLSLEPKFWPLRRVTPELPENSELESKVVKSFALNSSKIPTLDQLVLDVLVRSSTLLKLQRATAYCYRGITPKKSRSPGPLKTKELSRALKFWLKVEQNRCFSELIHALKKNKEVSKSFAKLSPYLDADGLIRVGGRLSLPHLNEDKHHPILVPCKSKLSELIVKFYHESFGHLGVSALHASVQQRFWIPSGRRIVRSVIFRCINCFKSKPRFPTPFMAALPSARTTVARAFEKVGVDFCGPVFVKPSNLRKAPKLKAYIAVFTCMTTRATHLESTTDLTTSSFLAALDRFVSRRGLPSDIFSDNGSNFRGADNELRQFFLDSGNNTTIADKLSGRNIQWHFNPPYAPHFGGVWESMVKSVKNHLVKTIGDVALTFEELYTVLTRVEAALNSRPITAISSDPNDFGALTPGHFLIMEPLVAIPTSDPTSNSLNHLQRWELVKRFQSLFWKRWSIEYLTTLQSRTKWTKKDKNLAVGTLVIVKEDNLPPLSWKLGRVIETFPGKDKQVRAANVKIPELLNGKITFGVYKRPVVKLAPLPIDIQC